MSMSESTSGNPRDEIEVFLAVGSVELATLAVFNGERITPE
jgi:hypothetical protein